MSYVDFTHPWLTGPQRLCRCVRVVGGGKQAGDPWGFGAVRRYGVDTDSVRYVVGGHGEDQREDGAPLVLYRTWCRTPNATAEHSRSARAMSGAGTAARPWSRGLVVAVDAEVPTAPMAAEFTPAVPRPCSQLFRGVGSACRCRSWRSSPRHTGWAGSTPRQGRR
jgi:hypothetical protein